MTYLRVVLDTRGDVWSRSVTVEDRGSVPDEQIVEFVFQSQIHNGIIIVQHLYLLVHEMYVMRSATFASY